MNHELIKIDTYIRSTYGSLTSFEDTFENLSKDDESNSLVSEKKKAFNFDLISNTIYSPQKHKSSDCLYLAEELYLIEFKGGHFRKGNTSFNEIKSSIIAKISTSLHTLEKIVLKTSNVDRGAIKINFVLVLNSGAQGFPRVAFREAQARRAFLGATYNLFSNYTFRTNQRIFYDKVIILTDINFSQAINSKRLR